MTKDEYVQIHENMLNGQARKIEALETRADYKDDAIRELKDDMKELKKDMKDLKEDINDFMLQSVNDDNCIKETLNNQDNRITTMETTLKVLQWITTLLFGSGVIWIIYSLIH